MEESLKARFIVKLEENYGEWDKMASRFGSATFGEISHDLSISSSQFSKLIYGTATEGMYQRSIENINRLIEKATIRQALKAAEAQNAQLLLDLQHAKAQKKGFGWKALTLSALGSALLILLLTWALSDPNTAPTKAKTISTHPLSHFFDQQFDAKFKSPYLDITEVHSHCPASAYEGIWSLAKPYKLPLPGMKKPGLYYYAKSADVRMKCSRFDTADIGKGRVLYGYEYLINEIWLDTKSTPLSPRYFDKAAVAFTPEFEALDFEANPQFKKVATVHSFFTDKFEIHPDSIIRRGEPCGRVATDIDEALAAAYQIDLKYILEQVLGDLTVTSCSQIKNPFPDPNLLQEGSSILAFDCLYTIEAENLGMGGGYPYTKGYLLSQQNYSNNLNCR